MGSSGSSPKGESEEKRKQRRLLMQRKVTTDLLEKLARSLPKVPNSLGKTLRLENDIIKELEWQGNLYYLEKWKLWKKDEATIGNLINLLKSTGIKDDVWECLFNISREPKNATTTMDASDETLVSNAVNHYDYIIKPSTACRISPVHLPNEVFNDHQIGPMVQATSSRQLNISTASRRVGTAIPGELMQQRMDQYPQESLLDDILRYHDKREHDRERSSDGKSAGSKTLNLHATIGDS